MSGFDVGVDWYKCTVPSASAEQVMARLGGDFVRAAGGFQGYPVAYVQTPVAGGVIKVGCGKPDKPGEVHVSCSGAVVSTWSYARLQALAAWVREQDGTAPRVDVAFDDRQGVISVEQVEAAVRAGQAVKRSRKIKKIEELNDETGEPVGTTLYLGSRESETLVRIYDKAAAQRAKGQDVEGPWVRWELELKGDRAQACALAISLMSFEAFRAFIVGVLRSAVDFRDTTRDAEPMERVRAPLLPWWRTLTEGFQKARLVVAAAPPTIERVMDWAARQLGPMLAVLAASPEAGVAWLHGMIQSGTDRWRTRHYALLGRRGPPRVAEGWA